MAVWTGFIELLRLGLFYGTQVSGGSLAGGIIVLSLAVRLALYPLTYSLARRGHTRAVRLAEAKPELERLRTRHRNDPARLAQETMALYRRRGLSLVDKNTLLGGLVQLPVVMGMFSVIRRALDASNGARFLWIGNIARPDALLAAAVSLSTFAVLWLSPQVTQHGARWIALISVIMTFGVMLKLNAGVGLYWAASSAVAGVQAVMVRRSDR
jgi:YidC/Oxa1 family membrane protein insertase